MIDNDQDISGRSPSIDQLEITPEPLYSVFTTWEKRWIVLLAAFAAMFSPMSSFIFYPAINAIAESLDVKVGHINLAITTYMIVSGIVPTLLGNAADTLGRRPIYLVALTIYLASNISLAIQNTYPGLLVLRMLQSVGSSGTISLGYGVLSDIITRAERGSYVGIMLLGPNMAPLFGPVLGGILTEKLGWKWTFWFLSILGGICLIIIALGLPETARVIVGNGSITTCGIYKPLICLTRKGKQKRQPTPSLTAESSKKLHLPNPLECLRVILLKDMAAVLVSNGICYMIYCCFQASLSSLFIEMYGFQTLQAGLIYIPFGVACLIATFTWGQVLDFDYNRIAKQHGIPAGSTEHQTSLSNFPIERARLCSAMSLIVLNTIATLAYGWVVENHMHIAVPLILQVIVGFTTTGLFTALGTLLTDLNPSTASTAAASANLVRCAMAALALGILEPVIHRIGVGWCFTILGFTSGLCGLLLFWEMRYGMNARMQRE